MSDTISDAPTQKRVLLTGASGRIGRAVAPALSERFDLRLWDKHDPGDITGLVTGDLADAASFRDALNGVDTVIHLAAQSTEADFVNVLVPNNVIGMYNLLENAVAAKVKRVVFASTIQAFDAYPKERVITPDDLPRPITLYGATKAFGETLGRWYHDKHGIEFLAVRIGWFLMPDSDHDLQLLQTHPGAKRIWLSPRDAARFFTLAVDAPTIGTDGYGIACLTSRPMHIRLALDSARALIGYEPLDDIRDYAQTATP